MSSGNWCVYFESSLASLWLLGFPNPLLRVWSSHSSPSSLLLLPPPSHPDRSSKVYLPCLPCPQPPTGCRWPVPPSGGFSRRSWTTGPVSHLFRCFSAFLTTTDTCMQRHTHCHRDTHRHSKTCRPRHIHIEIQRCRHTDTHRHTYSLSDTDKHTACLILSSHTDARPSCSQPLGPASGPVAPTPESCLFGLIRVGEKGSWDSRDISLCPLLRRFQPTLQLWASLQGRWPPAESRRPGFLGPQVAFLAWSTSQSFKHSQAILRVGKGSHRNSIWCGFNSRVFLKPHLEVIWNLNIRIEDIFTRRRA